MYPVALINLKNEVFYREMKPVFDELSHVQYAIVKGEILSYYSYGKFGMRNSSDMDLLISKQNLQEVEQALKNSQFHQVTRENEVFRTERERHLYYLTKSHQVQQYIKKTNTFTVNVDLNHDIFWGGYTGKPVDMNEFLADIEPISIRGCNAKTLPLYKVMIHLILHHYKDMNSIFLLLKSNTITTDKFQDIYQLWKSHTSYFMENPLFVQKCFEYHMAPYVFYEFYYTSKVFQDDCLGDFAQQFRSQEGEALLEQFGLVQGEYKQWMIPFEERLNHKDISSYIKESLNEDDYERLKLNHHLF